MCAAPRPSLAGAERQRESWLVLVLVLGAAGLTSHEPRSGALSFTRDTSAERQTVGSLYRHSIPSHLWLIQDHQSHDCTVVYSDF